VNAAAFYNDYRDLQVSYTDPAYPGTSVRCNAGKAHSAGVEVEASARLPLGLSLQATGGYLYAVYDTYDNAGGAGVDADGHRLTNSPRWNFSEGGTYVLLTLEYEI
jgi:iron complex outermembrane recepter protein